jgi:hypothetical protein
MADGGPAPRPALPDPEQRAAVVAELSALIAGAAVFSPAESAVLRHVLAHAGLGLDGRLRVPSFAALWGGEEGSYFPAAPIPAEQVRAAAKVLQRRAILCVAVADSSEHEGVILDADRLRALAG